jgi:hypothetical protein
MPSRLTAVLLAAALLLPATALAMPIDPGPMPDPQRAPEVRTVVRTGEATLAVALAGLAVVVATASAAYTVLRLRAPLGEAR